ncbi:hypothetical protein ACQKKX_01735 [Neorhizobium sp. NPDC001467]|uniref:hypothetical protein n=1 Tax=Neorhizobium sp. NPDC001467 TaxID=3390595 RepID=UPI003D088D46
MTMGHTAAGLSENGIFEDPVELMGRERAAPTRVTLLVEVHNGPARGIAQDRVFILPSGSRVGRCAGRSDALPETEE